MATGTLSSLGLGSEVLNQETLEKLKNADISARVKPYETKIETNTTKQKALTELTTKLAAFQSAVSSLGDSTAFGKRKVTPSVTGDSAAATLTASNGVSVQNLSVKVEKIAQKDVFQSKGLDKDTDKVPTAGEFTIKQNGKEYTIKVGATTTYADLAEQINSATDGNVIAKIIRTGEAGTPYRFTLSSKETGADNAITFKDDKNILKGLGWTLKTPSGTDGFSSLEDAKSEYHLKKAQDAEFTLDGVKMYRSTNEIKDIGAGLTLNLLKAGEINFDIKQDSEGLTSTMEELVEKYNELVNYLNDVTAYDSETKVSGDLADVNEVKSLRSTINKMLFTSQSIEGTTTDDKGNKTKTNVLVSVLDFGLSLNDTSKSNSSQLALLKFDSAKFEKKFAEDPDFAESFFSGTSGFEEVNVIGKAVKLESDIEFKGKDFKLTFGDKSYDLTKKADGTSDFKLDGADAKTRAQNLLDHINSFGINGLKASMQEFTLTEGGQPKKGYALKFKSDDGSDFEIAGDKEFLAKLGLEAQKISPETKTGTGVFSQLKSTLQSYTRVSTVDTKKGTLTLYGERLKTDASSLNDEKTKEQTRIDTYYEAMFSKWVQYDAIIANIKNQGTAITNMINAANNQNNK